MDVFLVSQNRLLREVLGKVLDRTADISIVASIEFDSTTHSRITQVNPDVLLIETGADGENQIMPLLRKLSTLDVVMIVMSAADDAFLRSSADAVACVLRDPSSAEVAEALRTAPRFRERLAVNREGGA
jgi:DNA-binding NarL/FixJ family response regulator